MRPRIDFVTATPRIIKDFGSPAAAQLEGPSSRASYEVDLEQIKSKLGRFIAQHITSTSSSDPGARILLLYPETNGEKFADDLFVSPAGQACDPLRQAASQSPEALAAALRSIADDVSRRKGKPQGSWASLRTSVFRWPVLGTSGQWEETPEEFIDRCSSWIHGSSAVPIGVGLYQARPDQLILASFLHGLAPELLKRYDSEERSVKSAARRIRGHLKLVNGR